MELDALKSVGLGSKPYEVAFCVANRPPLDDYPVMAEFRPLATGELDYIVRNTSNHWRKLFNVFAKFLFELRAGQTETSPRWQDYRDQHFLQHSSREALLFSAPQWQLLADQNQSTLKIHIIAGKTYAAALKLPFPLTWLDSYFAINKDYGVIVSPYLDYRQLSNERISRLVALVKSLSQSCAEGTLSER